MQITRHWKNPTLAISTPLLPVFRYLRPWCLAKTNKCKNKVIVETRKTDKTDGIPLWQFNWQSERLSGKLLKHLCCKVSWTVTMNSSYCHCLNLSFDAGGPLSRKSQPQGVRQDISSGPPCVSHTNQGHPQELTLPLCVSWSHCRRRMRQLSCIGVRSPRYLLM